MTDPDALLTVPEAAARLHIGLTLCRRLISTGELPSLRIGATRRIEPAAIAAYLARQVEAEQDRRSGYQVMAERKVRRIS